MRKEPTEAQRAAAKERRARMSALAKRIAGMTPEQQADLTKDNIVTIEGHVLSMRNQIMVAMQGCKSTIVGGFHSWRKAGRAVAKGSHGFAIWVPIGTKTKTDDGHEGVTDVTGFTLGTVFGVDQTEPVGAKP